MLSDSLSDQDLRLLAGVTKVESTRLRGDDKLMQTALSSQEVFETVFRPVDVRSSPVSPFLAFGVAIHRSAADLDERTWVAERVGHYRHIPVFDVSGLRTFARDGAMLILLVELLASYTHVASGAIWTRHAARWRRRRFSDLDLQQLTGLLEFVSPQERVGIYRRLGDLALFLNGVFPDHTARPARTIELERMLRTLSAPERRELGEREAEKLFDRGSLADALEVLGPRWYRTAAAGTPLPGLAAQLRQLAEQFDTARRFLNLVTDRILFPRYTQFFGAPEA
jgi:hypothetical protein